VSATIAGLYPRHCERSDLSAEASANAEAIQSGMRGSMDCFAALAMTGLIAAHDYTALQP
jgi:hypothetical protein